MGVRSARRSDGALRQWRFGPVAVPLRPCRTVASSGMSLAPVPEDPVRCRPVPPRHEPGTAAHDEPRRSSVLDPARVGAAAARHSVPGASSWWPTGCRHQRCGRGPPGAAPDPVVRCRECHRQAAPSAPASARYAESRTAAGIRPPEAAGRPDPGRGVVRSPATRASDRAVSVAPNQPRRAWKPVKCVSFMAAMIPHAAEKDRALLPALPLTMPRSTDAQPCR
jgi:hypothetical protein